MHEENIIKTAVFKSGPAFKSLRAKRIEEAIVFGGSIEHPQKHVISKLSSGKRAYFIKPGKEAQRQNPNIHDMFPCVGRGGTNDTSGYTFEIIWEYLVKISVINQLLFKKVLVLLYRVCFLIDHQENKQGNIRYAPSQQMLDYIGKIDFALKCGFKDKFKTEEIGLLEYLYFIDLLGWNEDVKYHVKNGAANFGGEINPNVGRPNTIISVISVPLMINDFLSNIIENVNRIEKINVRLILSTMQQLSKSRGVCVLSHVKLQKYLSPYLEKSNAQKIK